jgi:hypothetical protein
VVKRGRPGPPRRNVTDNAQRPSLLVFAEGEATERQYVNHWYRQFRHRVTVEFAEEHGTPMTLVQLAVSTKMQEERDERRGRGRGHSQIWCVFDRDEHPYLPEAFALAGAHGIHTAYSNPCLELWFLWHFQDQTSHIERHDAQRVCRTHLKCDKNLTNPALQALAEPSRYAQAKRRAHSLDTKHLGDGSPANSNPSSTVWRLIDTIQG